MRESLSESTGKINCFKVDIPLRTQFIYFTDISQTHTNTTITYNLGENLYKYYYKDHQRMIVDPMFMTIQTLRPFLTAVTPYDVAPTAVIL